MKNIILIITIVLSFYSVSLGAGRQAPDTEIQTVYEGTFVLDTNASDTTTSPLFIPWADSLSFVAEITYADSAGADGAKTTVLAKIRYLTIGGIQDTATFANLTNVVSLPATAKAQFGTTIAQISSKKSSKARLEIVVKNTNDGKQKIKIRIYAIKEWR